MINPGVQLPSQLRKIIDESFRGAIKNIGEEEFYYIGKNIKRKLAATQASSANWILLLAGYA